MHTSVLDIWDIFSEPLEGRVATLYADKLGLVSIGVGNLLDAADKDGKPLPIDVAWRMVKGQVIALRFELPAGIPASAAKIEQAWRAVRNDPMAKDRGWQYAKGIPANNIHLSREAIDELVMAKLAANDAAMQRRFVDWEERPADAQLAIHSMMWAMGSEFWPKFPKFSRAFSTHDYAKACERVDTDENNVPIYQCGIAYPIGPDGKKIYGTIRERNERNRQLLLNAASHTGDPSVLDWTA